MLLFLKFSAVSLNVGTHAHELPDLCCSSTVQVVCGFSGLQFVLPFTVSIG